MTQIDRIAEAISKKAAAIIAAYEADPRNDTVNLLLAGYHGSGKTSTAVSGRRPILIDSFDPGGTNLPCVQRLRASGDCLIDRRFETDDWNNPTKFSLWEREYNDRRRLNFFSAIGTYVIDSGTSFIKSALYQALKELGHTGKEPGWPEWSRLTLGFSNIVDSLMSLPCDTIITAHLRKEKDESTGRIQYDLALPPKISDQVPSLFSEKYILQVTRTSSGPKHMLQVRSDGEFKASTRIGGEIFAVAEEPDLMALYKKAGRNVEHKPKLIP